MYVEDRSRSIPDILNDPTSDTMSCSVDLNVDDRKERLLKRVEELKKQEELEEEKTFANAEPALDIQQSWPRRQQDEVHDKKVKDSKLKIEAAKNLLEKGLRQSNMSMGGGWNIARLNKDEVYCKSGGLKSSSEKESGCAIINRLKSKGSKGDAVKEKLQSSSNLENARQKSKAWKSGVKTMKNSKAKPSAQRRGKVSEDEESESSDPEDDFSDGESDTVKAKAMNRPKRRSAAAVKYFNSDDGEDFIDDSDKDSDFEQEKERHKKIKKKTRPVENSCFDNASKGFTGATKTVKDNIETAKTSETRHWLDEEGSSSDENDFEPVEPEKPASVDIVVHVNSDKKNKFSNTQERHIYQCS
ncbi:hypothetical protein ElyMa_003409100 [Elysia marginata]|uniref:CWF21 domain-containing protein n=1 Tax=Elysia marginata TaxID=1093978 RepID=A0AAV4JS38_9GAST|nr:hypothetical protein ElyMa_003409100 [Elysia marginata]